MKQCAEALDAAPVPVEPDLETLVNTHRIIAVLSLVLVGIVLAANHLGAPADAALPGPARDATPAPVTRAAAAAAGRLRGRVLAPNGQPAERAQVHVRRPTSFVEARMKPPPPLGPAAASTDHLGVFELADLPRGPLRVVVRRAGCVDWSAELVVSDEEVLWVDVRMEPAPVLALRVVSESGAAVPEARVAEVGARGLSADAAQRHIARAGERVAGDGSLALSLRSADPALLVSAPGYALAYVLPGERSALTCVLSRAFTLRGRVTGPGGAPVADAVLEVGPLERRSAQPFVAKREARSDGGGAFALAGLPAGRYSVRVHSAAGDAPRQTIDLGPGARALEFTLDGALSVLALVRDADGRPVSRALVEARRVGAAASGPARLFAAADEAGAARLRGLAQGRWELTAALHGERSLTRIVALDAPGAPAEVHLSLGRRAPLRIESLSPAGDAVGGVLFLAVPRERGRDLVWPSVRTSRAGRAELALPEGVYDVFTAGDREGGDARAVARGLEVGPRGAVLRAVLREQPLVDVTALRAGRPLPGALVGVMSAGDLGALRLELVTGRRALATARDGRALLRAPRVGDTVVFAREHPLAPPVLRRLNVGPGVTSVALELSTSGVRGTLRRADGAALARAVLRLTPKTPPVPSAGRTGVALSPDASDVWGVAESPLTAHAVRLGDVLVTTDAQGGFDVRGLPHGHYVVELDSQDFALGAPVELEVLIDTEAPPLDLLVEARAH